MTTLQLSRVEDNTLYPLFPTPPDFSKYRGTTFASCLLERVAKHLKEQGDRPWITNGAKRLTGKSRVMGVESYNLAEVHRQSFCLQHIHIQNSRYLGI